MSEAERIAMVEANWRAKMGDETLTIFDIAGIQKCAKKFGVSERMAYLRAKGLGLLTQQAEGK